MQYDCTLQYYADRIRAARLAYLRRVIDADLIQRGIAERARAGRPCAVPAAELLRLLDDPDDRLIGELIAALR